MIETDAKGLYIATNTSTRVKTTVKNGVETTSFYRGCKILGKQVRDEENGYRFYVRK